MRTQETGIDARRDVLTRRILAQGATPEEWGVEVAQPVEGVWTTTFYVGAQGFRLAENSSNERKVFSGGRGASQSTPDGAEQHCQFIGEMFVKALLAFKDAETEKYRSAISRANDQLFDSRVDDSQHQVDSHADTLPQVFLSVVAGHDAALETLQTVVREWADPEPATGFVRITQRNGELPNVKRLDPPEDVGGGVLRVAEVDDGTGASQYQPMHEERVLGLQGYARSAAR